MLRSLALVAVALIPCADSRLFSMNPEKKADQKIILKELMSCKMDVIVDVRHNYYHANWRIKGSSHYPWDGRQLHTRQENHRPSANCKDGKKTGLFDSRTKKQLSCPQLRYHCDHKKYGAHIRKNCCKTCSQQNTWTAEYIKENNITNVAVYCWMKPWQSDPAARWLEKKFGNLLNIFDMKGLSYLDDIPGFCPLIDGTAAGVKKFAPHCKKKEVGSHRCNHAKGTLYEKYTAAKNKAEKAGTKCGHADVTDDGEVNIQDLLKTLEHFHWDGQQKVDKDIVSGAAHTMPDVNEDLKVNIEDLLIVMGFYHHKC